MDSRTTVLFLCCQFPQRQVFKIVAHEGDTLMTPQVTPLTSQSVSCSLLTSLFQIAWNTVEYVQKSTGYYNLSLTENPKNRDEPTRVGTNTKQWAHFCPQIKPVWQQLPLQCWGFHADDECSLHLSCTVCGGCSNRFIYVRSHYSTARCGRCSPPDI